MKKKTDTIKIVYGAKRLCPENSGELIIYDDDHTYTMNIDNTLDARDMIEVLLHEFLHYVLGLVRNKRDVKPISYDAEHNIIYTVVPSMAAIISRLINSEIIYERDCQELVAIKNGNNTIKDGNNKRRD